MTTYWLVGEKPVTDLIPEVVDSSDASVSVTDAVSITNISLTSNPSVYPVVSCSNNSGVGTSHPVESNMTVLHQLSPTGDNNFSPKERQSVCFDKDIPNSIIIEPSKRLSTPKDHQQEVNNITKSASKGLIEA